MSLSWIIHKIIPLLIIENIYIKYYCTLKVGSGHAVFSGLSVLKYPANFHSGDHDVSRKTLE